MTDLREAMRQARTADAVLVDVPAWGQKVYLRPLAVREQLELKDEGQDPALLSLRIILHSIVDENGERLLEDSDFELLLDQPFPVLIPLFRESARVNGLDTAEMQEAVELFEKAQSERRSSE